MIAEYTRDEIGGGIPKTLPHYQSAPDKWNKHLWNWKWKKIYNRKMSLKTGKWHKQCKNQFLSNVNTLSKHEKLEKLLKKLETVLRIGLIELIVPTYS